MKLIEKGQWNEKAMKHGHKQNKIQQFGHKERKEVTKNKERKIKITKNNEKIDGRKDDRNKRKRGKEILKVKEKETWKGTNKNDRNRKGQVVTRYSSESKRQIQESSALCRSDQRGAVSNYGKTRKNGRVCDNELASFTLPNTKPSIEFTHPTS